eukprot:3228555-Prymnesium_polylepis.1
MGLLHYSQFEARRCTPCSLQSWHTHGLSRPHGPPDVEIHRTTWPPECWQLHAAAAAISPRNSAASRGCGAHRAPSPAGPAG